ncbi:unnamed protein product [Darwinula stevensoni]|uniref:Uncharacterized protein n=1 Tax=Darwinula stevensoni TaxID=69355 RepID=A0A7R8X612_9CRUS|nr:unnamed protein product [Darwinula stevensoni]CAG0887643.1 unnamed protein product [Darwinula stevensoni]
MQDDIFMQGILTPLALSPELSKLVFQGIQLSNFILIDFSFPRCSDLSEQLRDNFDLLASSEQISQRHSSDSSHFHVIDDAHQVIQEPQWKVEGNIQDYPDIRSKATLQKLSKVIDEQYSGLDVGMETQAHLMAALLTSNPDCLKDNKTLTRLNDIALQPNGMQLIFALTRIADSRVLEVITAWFREYLQELDASKVKSIVTLPPAMKQSAFASFSGMFDVWTAFLSQEGKCQNPEYVNEEIQWRCGFPGFLSTEQLINEWKLLMAKKDTKERTQALLRDLRSQEGCSFWDFLECAREHTIHSSVEQFTI